MDHTSSGWPWLGFCLPFPHEESLKRPPRKLIELARYGGRNDVADVCGRAWGNRFEIIRAQMINSVERTKELVLPRVTSCDTPLRQRNIRANLSAS